MSITSLLRKQGETLEQYRTRFNLSTSLSPEFVIDNEQAKELIDKICDGDEDLRQLMLDHVLNGGLIEDYNAIFLIGLVMVYNPIQLIRFKEAIDLEVSTRELLEKDQNLLDEILEAQMYVLKDKAARAVNLVKEFEGMDESPFHDERMSNHWVGTKDISNLKSVAIAIMEAKAKAIAGLKGLQDTLSKIADVERRTKAK